jgi:hypothetical protein
MMSPGIGAVAELLSKVFGFVVDPQGLAKMKREHQLQILNAGILIAIDQKDVATIDQLFNRYRELSETVGL